MLRRLAGVIVLLATLFSSRAQESFRNSLEYDTINRQRQQNIESQYYNVKLGPVRMTMSAGLTTTYNDNINLSETNAQSDFIVRPSFGIGAMWQITEFNRLAIDADIGFNKYISHSRYDRLDVSPGSTSDISYDLMVGQVRLNFHDRFFYSQDPMQVQTVTDEADLGRFRNTLGLVGVIPFKDLTVSLGYDHVNFVYLNDAFKHSTYAAEMFFARVGYQVNPTLMTGVEASMGMTEYDTGLRPNNRNYTAGPFVMWRASELIQTEARAGISTYELSSTAASGDMSAPLSYYASLSLRHQINSRVAQTIRAGRDTQQGVSTTGLISSSGNFTETMYVQHSATWRVIHNVTLSSQLFYEYSESKMELNFLGLFTTNLRETVTRYGGGLSLGYQLGENINAALRWTHSIREGAVDFTQNAVTLALGYKF